MRGLGALVHWLWAWSLVHTSLESELAALNQIIKNTHIRTQWFYS